MAAEMAKFSLAPPFNRSTKRNETNLRFLVLVLFFQKCAHSQQNSWEYDRALSLSLSLSPIK